MKPAVARPRRRRVAIAAAVLGGVAALCFGAPVLAAAGATSSSTAVAQVGSASITKGAFRHWLTIANDAATVATGAAAPPLPLPPGYAACIAAERLKAGGATKTTAALKARCAADYKLLRTEVMSYLVQAIWIQGEAARRGVHVTAAQINAAYEKQRKTATPSLATTAELDRFLARSGQTITDLKWRTFLNLLANKLTARVQKAASRVSAAQIAAYYSAHPKQFKGESLAAATPSIKATIVARQQAKADAQLQKEFTVTWRARTACRRGYSVSALCSQLLTATTQLPGTDTGHVVLPPSRPQKRKA